MWPFGPREDQCRAHSPCWQGILACGKFDAHALVKELSQYIDAESEGLGGPSRIPKKEVLRLSNISSYDQGWSMRSVHVNVRLLGPELLAPTLRRVAVQAVGAEQGVMDEVIVADFVPTIAGTYAFDARLVAFFPGEVIMGTDAASLSYLHQH